MVSMTCLGKRGHYGKSTKINVVEDVVSVMSKSQILQGCGNLENEFVFKLSSMGTSNWRVSSNEPGGGSNLHC